MAQHRQQTKQTPSLPGKTVYLLKLKRQPERYTSGLLKAMEEHSDDVDQKTPALCSPLLLIHIACSFAERSLYTHLEPWVLQMSCKCFKGTSISKSPALKPSRGQYESPTGFNIFVYSESCCLMVWLQVSLMKNQ